MRIPFAERIRFKYAVMFAVFIFLAQMLEGTNLAFSVLCAAFICLSCIAFNMARGFLYPSGAFIFFNAMLTCIVGFTYKILLNEPGDSHLQEPNTLMLAYCLSMVVYGVVATFTRKLAPSPGLLSGMSTGESMKKAAVGALLLGGFLEALSLNGTTPGSFLAAVRQLNLFMQMSILLATFYQVKKTNGRESSNWVVWTAVTWGVFFGGVLGSSKAGFLTAPVTWVIAAITAGYDFRRKQIIGIVFAIVFFQVFLVPYSQTARNFREETPTLAGNLHTAEQLLGDIGQTRATYQEDAKNAAAESGNQFSYYERPQGFFDRLNIMGPDDALFAYTDEGNYEGLMPTYISLLNVIPHFLWQNKPVFYAGNEYGREIGIIDDQNEGTGISFSPTADAYHQVGWYGLALLAVIIFVLFMVMDGLSGDLRLAPWGLLFTVLMAHSANEGMIGGQIYIFTYVALGVVIVALMSKYVLPIVSGVITNTDRTRVVQTRTFQAMTKPVAAHEQDSAP